MAEIGTFQGLQCVPGVILLKTNTDARFKKPSRYQNLCYLRNGLFDRLKHRSH